jgi:hypothetical protein
MNTRELRLIGAGLRTRYEAAKKAPLTPSMLALLVQLREAEDKPVGSSGRRDWAAAATFRLPNGNTAATARSTRAPAWREGQTDARLPLKSGLGDR